MMIAKYQKENLFIGETVIVNDKCQITHLHNKECLIKGSPHPDMPSSMYVEILDKFMTIKCRHNECFAKTYPCNHILMNKNETNIRCHGIDFCDAGFIFEHPMLIKTDTRKDYGEERLIGLGLLFEAVIIIVFTKRGNSIRVISIRRANKNERKHSGGSFT